MKKLFKKLKRKWEFRKNMKTWVRLCKCKPMTKIMGVAKVGELTHKYNIKNVGEIKTKYPIFVSYE